MQASQAAAQGAKAPVPPRGLTGVSVPSTTEEAQAVIAKRSELLTQLRAAETRKAHLLDAEANSPAARTSRTERLNVVNEDIIRLESELAVTSWQIANTPMAVLPSSGWRLAGSTSSQPPQTTGLTGSHITGIAIVGILFFLFPIAIATARLIWRRATMKGNTMRDVEGAQRLKRMEHAVDAMAIEVERISEGQRFLTQIFAKEPSFQVADRTQERS